MNNPNYIRPRVPLPSESVDYDPPKSRIWLIILMMVFCIVIGGFIDRWYLQAPEVDDNSTMLIDECKNITDAALEFGRQLEAFSIINTTISCQESYPVTINEKGDKLNLILRECLN